MRRDEQLLWKHWKGFGAGMRSAQWHFNESYTSCSKQSVMDKWFRKRRASLTLHTFSWIYMVAESEDFSLSKLTGCILAQSKKRRKKFFHNSFFPLCVCRCVCACGHICVGLCQKMAELSGMRWLLHSLAVGGSIMRETEGCLCVGECFSAISICIACVSLKCTIKTSIYHFFSFFFFLQWQRAATQVTDPMAKMCPKARKRRRNTDKRTATVYTNRADSDATLPDELVCFRPVQSGS